MEKTDFIKNNGLMIAATAILGFTLAFSAYYKTHLVNSDSIIAQAEVDSSCDLQKSACSLRMPNGGEVTFAIESRPIPLLENFTMSVDLKSIDANAVTVDFQGTTMNMGLNRFMLQTKTTNGFKGTGVLPVCIRNSMEWKAQVIVKTDDGALIAPFIFTTHK